VFLDQLTRLLTNRGIEAGEIVIARFGEFVREIVLGDFPWTVRAVAVDFALSAMNVTGGATDVDRAMAEIMIDVGKDEPSLRLVFEDEIIDLEDRFFR
jgi:hypothetical protein